MLIMNKFLKSTSYLILLACTPSIAQQNLNSLTGEICSNCTLINPKIIGTINGIQCGQSDSTNLINNALKSGGRVQLSGTCIVSSPIVLSESGTEFWGTNNATIAPSSSWTGGIYGDAGIIVAGATNLNIHDLTLDGSNALTTVSAYFSGIINTTDISNSVYLNNTIKNVRFDGINVNSSSGVSNLTIAENKIINSGWDGIGLGFCTACTVFDNKVYYTGWNGIHTAGGTGDIIDGNYVTKANPPPYIYNGPGSIGPESGGLLGFEPTSLDIHITNNVLDNNINAAGDGIILLGENGVEFPGPTIISHNSVLNAGGAGIDIPGRGVVNNNTIENTLGYGILIGFDYGGTMQGVVVSNNSILNPGSSGGSQCIFMGSIIHAGTAYKDFQIVGNSCRDTRTTPLMGVGFIIDVANGSSFSNIQVSNNDFSDVQAASIQAIGSTIIPPVIFSDNQLYLPEKSENGSSFDVTGYHNFILTQTGATNFTNFLNGYNGQTIIIRAGDNNTTIVFDNSNSGSFGTQRLVGNSNISYTMQINDLLTCSKNTAFWTCNITKGPTPAKTETPGTLLVDNIINGTSSILFQGNLGSTNWSALSGANGSLSVNASGGSSELDYVQINSSATTAHTFWQKTGTSTANRLLDIYPDGSIYATGPFTQGLTTWTDNNVCKIGEMTWDANYIYICTNTNTVKRVALSSF